MERKEGEKKEKKEKEKKGKEEEEKGRRTGCSPSISGVQRTKE